jgi:L-iditol 2-dehydrogenase
MTGRVAVLSAPERFDVQPTVDSQPGPGEVVVRVAECGICGSDLKMYAGTHAFMRPPIVMGHEISGTVEAVGDGVDLRPGAPVTLFPPVGCGSCFHCRAGQEQLCEDMEFFGGQRPGGLATFVVAPRSHVVPVPPDVPPELRVLIEPLAVSVHGVARGQPAPGERAVVVGAGAIGLFAAAVLRSRGLEDVILAERLPERRSLAASLGFETVDPTVEGLPAAVARLVRPEGADVVFECVGSQPTIAAALSSTRKGGRTVVVGNAPPSLEVDGLALQRGDRSLVGVLMYEIGDFETAMSLLAGGLLDGVDTDRLVARYTLDRVGEAFADARHGRLRALKAVVEL